MRQFIMLGYEFILISISGAHAEDKSHQFNRLLECCRLLSDHADPLIDDNEGRSAAAIAKVRHTQLCSTQAFA